jgi:hypothetical protein
LLDFYPQEILEGTRKQNATKFSGGILVHGQSLLLSDDGEWCLSPWARQQLVAFRDRLMPPAKTVAWSIPNSKWQTLERCGDAFRVPFSRTTIVPVSLVMPTTLRFETSFLIPQIVFDFIRCDRMLVGNKSVKRTTLEEIVQFLQSFFNW